MTSEVDRWSCCLAAGQANERAIDDNAGVLTRVDVCVFAGVEDKGLVAAGIEDTGGADDDLVTAGNEDTGCTGSGRLTDDSGDDGPFSSDTLRDLTSVDMTFPRPHVSPSWTPIA